VASDPPLDPDLEALLDQNDPALIGQSAEAGSDELDPDLEALLDANDPAKRSPLGGAPLRGGAFPLALEGPLRQHEPQHTITPEEIARGQRFILETGIPLAAGALLGPAGAGATRGALTGGRGLAALAPAAQELLARTGLMGLASVMGAEAGNLVDPPASEEEAAARRNSAGAAGLLGETAIPGGLGLAGGMVKPLLRFADRQAAKAGGFALASLNRASRDEATRVGRVMREQGVLGWRPVNAETLLQRAEAVQAREGRRLGDIRAEVDLASPGASVDDMLEEIRSVLGGDQATLRDIVPGSSTEQALLRQLSAAEGDVRSFARQGAKDAPVVGPEGDRAFWEMPRAQVIESSTFAPHIGPNQSTMYDELAGHRQAIEDALRAGQPVPAQVLRDYPELAEIYPDFANTSTLGALKKQFADLAYEYGGQAGRSPDTLGGMIAPRWEDARGVVQGAEEGLVAGARPELFDEFMRAKDTYGAMERLTNARTGVAEAAANRALGNNQVFGLTSQLAALSGRTGEPLEAGLRAAIARFLHQRGNQLTAKGAQAGSRFFGGVEASSPLGRYLALLGNQGLGLATEEP